NPQRLWSTGVSGFHQMKTQTAHQKRVSEIKTRAVFVTLCAAQSGGVDQCERLRERLRRRSQLPSLAQPIHVAGRLQASAIHATGNQGANGCMHPILSIE